MADSPSPTGGNQRNICHIGESGSGLAKTLQSPEATKQLVDSIVKVDEQTGETSLHIPVPDKESVANVLGMLGKLFGGK